MEDAGNEIIVADLARFLLKYFADRFVSTSLLKYFMKVSETLRLTNPVRWFIALLCIVGSLAWGLTICSQCAHEQPDTANFCTHCGARLAAGETQKTDVAGEKEEVAQENKAAAADGDGDVAEHELLTIIRAATRDDVLLGREYLEKGRPDVARALLLNALALNAVAPEALTVEQGEHIMQEISQCEQKMSLGNAACQDCNGSGKRIIRFSQLTSDEETSMSTGQTCPTCQGTGRVRKTRSVNDMKYVLGQARQQMEQALSARGRVTLGGAWVPSELPGLLDQNAEARLRHAAAAPCQACQGLGRTDCNRCNNLGTITCTARGCNQGMVIREELRRPGTRTEVRRREPCTVCAGTARVECPRCQGAGSITCSSCQGTGKRPLCSACGGDGVSTCRNCRGTGKLRNGADCVQCGGGGVARCPTCRGDGYRGR